MADPRARSQEHQRENDTGSTRSHNLLCKATYHYFCHFLLARVRSQSLSTIIKKTVLCMGSLGTILGPGCHLIRASNDILQTVLQIQYPCIVKGNQRFKPKTQKKHKASDTGVQLSDRVFKSCIFTTASLSIRLLMGI